MCGRYTNTSSSQSDIAGRFGLGDARAVPREGLGRANVCPTDPVLAVVGDGEGGRRAEMLRWGLVPGWASLKGMRPLINAREDKLRSSGAWKRLAGDARHRCLIVADGWFEWQRPEDRNQPRQPFWHRLRGGETFAFAGLWTVARPKDASEKVASCLIVTVDANRDAAVLHDRMPAVLGGPDEEAAWLDPAVDLDGALELVRPLPDGSLEITPVSPELNAAGVEGLELLRPEAAGGDGRAEPRQSSLL